MQKGIEKMIREGTKCFVMGSSIASDCIVSEVFLNGIKFISDSGFKKGENLTFQLNEEKSYQSVPLFLSAKIKKISGGGNGSAIYEAVLG